MTTPPLACVILAAGRGTRMKSDTPKLLHPACGRPVLEWTLQAILELGPARTVVVVPPDGDALRAVLPEGVEAATQERPLGTGDAARSARAALAGFDGDILVMNGDHPLTDPASLRELAAQRAASAAAAAVLTFDAHPHDRRRLRPHRPRPGGRRRADRRAARHDALSSASSPR